MLRDLFIQLGKAMDTSLCLSLCVWMVIVDESDKFIQ